MQIRALPHRLGVTLSLANGKSEAWVSARTGHRSSDMINRYRRIAQSVAELSLGELRPLDEAIPELRAAADKSGEVRLLHAWAGDPIARVS